MPSDMRASEKLWLVEMSRLVTEFGDVCVRAANRDEAIVKAEMRLKDEPDLIEWEWDNSDRPLATDVVQEVSEAEGYAADIE